MIMPKSGKNSPATASGHAPIVKTSVKTTIRTTTYYHPMSSSVPTALTPELKSVNSPKGSRNNNRRKKKKKGNYANRPEGTPPLTPQLARGLSSATFSNDQHSLASFSLPPQVAPSIAIDIPNETNAACAPEEGEEGVIRAADEPKESWGSWFKKKGTSAFKLALAITPSLQPMLNAAGAATNTNVKDFSASWFENLSRADKAWTLTTGISSFLSNIFPTLDFVPRACRKLFKGFKKCANSVKDLSSSTISIVLGTSAAMTTGAMAYSAFIWAKAPTALSLTFISFISAFTSRYASIIDILNSLRGLFNPAQKDLKKIVKDLRNLSLAEITLLNQKIKPVLPATKDFKGFTPAIITADIVPILNNPESRVNSPSSRTFSDNALYLLEYPGKVLDIGLTSLVGSFVFPTFVQKGFDAINLVATQAVPSGFNNYSNAQKFGLGLLPGIPSTILYMNTAYNFRRLLLDQICGLRTDPSTKKGLIAMFIVALAIEYMGGNSMYGVDETILEDPKHIFNFMLSGSILGTASAILNQIGGTIVNTNSFLKMISSNNPDIEGLITYLRGLDVDDLADPEVQAAITNVNNSSFFQPARTPTVATRPEGTYSELPGGPEDTSGPRII
jgi:hypothetical protein